MAHHRFLGALVWLGVSWASASAQQPSTDLQERPCRTEMHELASALVGTWHEYTITPTGERFEGELTSSLEADGCAFVQSYVSADGGFTFRSLGYVDAEAWVEHFVLSDGRTAVYVWERDGADILLNRRERGPDRYRLRVSEILGDSYLVIEERRTEGADAWVQGERTRTRRVQGPGA